MKKLTIEQIEEIKALRNTAKTLKELSKQFGVSPADILWHTSELHRDKMRAYQRDRWRSLTPEQRQKLNERRREWMKSYMNRRYHQEEEFRLKQIKRSLDFQSRHYKKEVKVLNESTI